MVIVDTSAWIPFFNQPRSREKREIDALIDTVISKLSGLRVLNTGFATWRRAGELSFPLRRKGVTLPLSDLVALVLPEDSPGEAWGL